MPEQVGPLVSAVAVDEALCVARRRPWQVKNLVVVGRRADRSLVTVKPLDDAGWCRVAGGR
jgi:hypothetical protein